MTCTCEDWNPQIKHIDAPIVLQTIRSGGNYQYQGKPFKYCPWCGKELTHEATQGRGK